MEIITYVRRGAITHRDHLDNTGRTAAGDVQGMSAGTGIMHAEFNREDEATQIFQTWNRLEEHTYELPSLMRKSHAVFGLKKRTNRNKNYKRECRRMTHS